MNLNLKNYSRNLELEQIYDSKYQLGSINNNSHEPQKSDSDFNDYQNVGLKYQNRHNYGNMATVRLMQKTLDEGNQTARNLNRGTLGGGEINT